MHFVRDRVLYKILSDPNNNKEVDPIFYVRQFYARLRQDVDIATKEKRISLKSTEEENIVNLEQHRDKTLSLIGERQHKTLSKCRENYEKFKLSLNNFVQSFSSPNKSECEEEEKAKEKVNYEDAGKLYLSLKQEIFGEDLFFLGWRVCAKDNASSSELCSECQQFPGALISVHQSCLDDLQIDALNENSTASNQSCFQSVDSYLMQIWTLYRSIRRRETLQPSATFSDKFQEDWFEIYFENSKNIKKDTFHKIITSNLKISSSTIESIEEGTFENLVNLKTLLINDTRIDRLEMGLFRNLKELNVLNLSENKISQLNIFCFIDLSNLESLSLCSNQLAELVPNCFNGMPKLKELDLTSNKLTRIKRSYFAQLTSLTKLDLTCNSISRVQCFSLANLVNLTELNLSDNNILQVTIYTFKGLVNLKQLDLSRNGIEVLQCFAFRDLKKLECLDLSANCLSTIKANHLYGLKSLIELNLRHNSIELIENGAFRHFDDIKKIGVKEHLKNSFNLFI